MRQGASTPGNRLPVIRRSTGYVALDDAAAGDSRVGAAGRMHLTGRKGTHSRRTCHHSTTTTHTALEVGGIR
ncbi:hypothetical protein [Mycobacterium riyadhense]|uniref:hypothetical protein n=1 Tax=Mycobacterium riyadhense TaxID=486698 RepID=UPI00195681FF|nr:hypothetical protein [Mycobacterium riyadhense]